MENYIETYNPHQQIPEKFQENHLSQSSMIFHHNAWLNVINKTYHYPSYLVSIDKGDGNCYSLPFCEVRKLSGKKRWICLPFSDYYEPLFPEDDYASVSCHLWNELNFRNLSSVEIRWKFLSPYTDLRTDYVLHKLNLDGGMGKLEKKFSHSHRSSIHKALRSNLKVEISQTLSSTQKFYDLHILTRKKHGVPVQPWRFFKSIQSEILDQNMGFWILVNYMGECIAGLLCLTWQKTLTAKFSASNCSKIDLRPNNLMFYEAIRWGCENGYDILEFGKTDIINHGLKRFKTGWGAEEIPLAYSFISKEKYTQNLHTGKTINIMCKILKKCPPRINVILGELFYRYFP